MIYGDSPIENIFYQDPLGLSTYTYIPNIYAITQSGNLYGYCLGNPIKYIDPNGKDAGVAALAPEILVGVTEALVAIMGPLGLAAALIIGVGAGLITYGINNPPTAYDDALARYHDGLGSCHVGPDAPASPYNNSLGGIGNLFSGWLGSIASSYGIGQCAEAAEAMARSLTNNKQHFSFVEFKFYDGLSDFVFSQTYPGIAISVTGYHVGIYYNGLVYCNIHPNGLPLVQWLSDFIGLGVMFWQESPTMLGPVGLDIRYHAMMG